MPGQSGHFFLGNLLAAFHYFCGRFLPAWAFTIVKNTWCPCHGYVFKAGEWGIPKKIKSRNMALRVVFMGTPEFAAGCLAALLDRGHEILAVVTVPDKPAGRGRLPRLSAVKQLAQQANLPLLQPESLKNAGFLAELRNLAADVFVVVAFRMLPEAVWSMPPKGCINLHASLLPDYRGAAPINHAIIQGEKVTGVTTFFIEKEIDTGNIILSESTEIEAGETAGSLHDKLMHLGVSVLLKTLEGLESGSLNPISQQQLLDPTKPLHTAPKIHKEDCLIDWHVPGNLIYLRVNGLSPYPAAFFVLDLESARLAIKVFRCRFMPVDTASTPEPGVWETDGKTFFRVKCLDGWIYLDDLQMEGRKRMPVEDFLRGVRL